MSCDVMWSHVMSGDVRWCHVMSWSHVMSGDVMWSHVMSCEVMLCQVMSCDSHMGCVLVTTYRRGKYGQRRVGSKKTRLVRNFWNRNIPFSGKLSREKTSMNLKVLWLFTNLWFINLGVWHPCGRSSEQSAKVFSLESFPQYGTLKRDRCTLTNEMAHL